MVAEEFLKDNQKIEISYNGKIKPKKDGFIIHTTGYDYGIGNEIIGFFDLGKYKNLSKKKVKKITQPYKNAITSGFYYFNALEVIDFYKKCVLEMNISMIEEYNKRINKFDFFITIK